MGKLVNAEGVRLRTNLYTNCNNTARTINAFEDKKYE